MVNKNHNIKGKGEKKVSAMQLFTTPFLNPDWSHFQINPQFIHWGGICVCTALSGGLDWVPFIPGLSKAVSIAYRNLTYTDDLPELVFTFKQ